MAEADPSVPEDAPAELTDFPEVEFGHGSVLRIPELVDGRGIDRVLLVTGRGSFEASGASACLPRLLEVADVFQWRDFAVNVEVLDVMTGWELMRSYRPDLVLGIGGGSVMDMAKLLCATSSIEAADTIPAVVRSGVVLHDRTARLALVPTTSGSGSEATHFAVAYMNGQKYSVAGPALRADTVVLDPCLGMTPPKYQRAVSGIDAVCQAIESLWARSATSTSRDVASRALAWLVPNIVSFVNDPALRDATAMSIGSHLAGRGIDVTRTTAAHALSYVMTKRFGVSHGQAVAVTIGPLLALHADADAASLHPDVSPSSHAEGMNRVIDALGAGTGAEARERFARLLTDIGLTAHLSDLGIGKGDHATLLEGVNAERLGNNPVLLDRSDLASILHMAH